MLNLFFCREKPTSASRCLPMLTAIVVLLSGLTTVNAQPTAFQGFENPADVTCWSGGGTITRVPSGAGTLGVPSYDGNFHAEITNLDDDYQNPGYGDRELSNAR